SVAGLRATVRIIASSAVLATAVEESTTELMLINGQAADAQIGHWVAPYFKNGDGVSSHLALANPSPIAPTNATVSFYNNAGELVFTPRTFVIPANGSIGVSWTAIAGSFTSPPPGDGWVAVDSKLPVTGVTLVTNGWSVTAIPLQ